MKHNLQLKRKKIIVVLSKLLGTVSENIIATSKIRNNYGAIQSLIFPPILDFSLLLLVKLSLLIPFASFLVSFLCFFFDGFLSKIIAMAIVVALKGDSYKITITFRQRLKRATTIWEAIQKRIHEPIFKTH